MHTEPTHDTRTQRLTHAIHTSTREQTLPLSVYLPTTHSGLMLPYARLDDIVLVLNNVRVYGCGSTYGSLYYAI
jgi:hypothetical protein